MLDNVSEVLLRLSIFLGVFLILASIEFIRPRRHLTVEKIRRWTTNLSIIALDGLLVRALSALSIPLAATAAAYYAGQHGIGLFNVLDWPAWLELTICVVVLDLAIWLQHLVFHKVPLLWRLHQVHHADRDIDVTTAIRFHPIEIGISLIWKIACVFALGASVVSVIVFEILLNACAMFSHANIRLPLALDRILRVVLVTPDMHRVHHSTVRYEHDSNYGFNFSIWDRLFCTYRAQPEKGHDAMTIGLAPYQTDEPMRLSWSLLVPFKRWPKEGGERTKV